MRSIGQVGEWDLFVVLADRYHWTPEQVGRLDPQFVEELLAYIQAQADVAREEERRAARKARRSGVSGG